MSVKRTESQGVLRKLYWHIFNYIAAVRLKKNDLDPRVIHAHLITVLCTGVLMWAYVAVSFIFMSSTTPKVISLVASIVHLISPLFYRFSNRVFLISNIMLLAGMSHQLVSAFYSGGFNSYILIWSGILPSLAGIISGMRGLVLWATLTTSVCLVLLLMDINGFNFPGSGDGIMSPVFQSLMVFGWIFINTTMMYAHLIMQQRYERKLSAQNANISMLLKVLTHDMSTPVASINAASWALKTRQGAPEHYIDNIDVACQSLTDMTKRVQQMYLLANESLEIKKQPCSLVDCVGLLSSLFEMKLQHKSLTFTYDEEKLSKIRINVDPGLFTHQVMANLLSNAVKFSYHNGTIRLDAEEKGDTVAITLEDEGTGIEGEKLARLFTVEKNVSSMGTESELGIGYGLNIVKTFVTSFGGKITAESPPSGRTVQTPFKGTRFTITLPAG